MENFLIRKKDKDHPQSLADFFLYRSKTSWKSIRDIWVMLPAVRQNNRQTDIVTNSDDYITLLLLGAKNDY